MFQLLMQMVHRHHREVSAVELPVVGPTHLQFKAARARARRDDLHIPAWEPHAPFARPGTDVAATWRDRG